MRAQRGSPQDSRVLAGMPLFSQRIPGAPAIVAPLEGEVVDPAAAEIRWCPVTTPAGVVIAGYEVIVGGFEVTVSAQTTSVTVPPEFLAPGTEYLVAVLSIEANGNPTISSSSFVTA